ADRSNGRLKAITSAPLAFKQSRRLLQRMQRQAGGGGARRCNGLPALVEGGQPFQGYNRLADHAGNRRYTRANLLDVKQDGAGPTLREPTAEVGSLQMQLIAQHVEQGGIRASPHR